MDIHFSSGQLGGHYLNGGLITEHLMTEILLLVDQKWSQFLERSTKFKSDTCCYCLDAEPNVVIYSCGHQCSCSDCVVQAENQDAMNKCPMCRGIIYGLYDTLGKTMLSIDKKWNNSSCHDDDVYDLMVGDDGSESYHNGGLSGMMGDDDDW